MKTRQRIALAGLLIYSSPSALFLSFALFYFVVFLAAESSTGFALAAIF